MRCIVLVIIVLLSVGTFTPSIWAKQPFLLSTPADGNESDTKPTKTEVLFTPSIDEFLDDNLSLSEADLVNSQNRQITPSIGIFMSDRKLSSKYLDSSLVATSFIDSFLEDNWIPSSFVPPTYTALYPNRQNITLNSTNLIYDFLNDTLQLPSNSMENIYGPRQMGYLDSFLDPSWTPSNAAEIKPQSDVPFKRHVMN